MNFRQAQVAQNPMLCPVFRRPEIGQKITNMRMVIIYANAANVMNISMVINADRYAKNVLISTMRPKLGITRFFTQPKSKL
jgi:hypothetical protein